MTTPQEEVIAEIVPNVLPMNSPALKSADDYDVEALLEKVSIEVVTPDKARYYLTKSVNNRMIRMADVEEYARDMTAGHWDFNYDPVRFTDDGNLLDGHHRLHAIVLANRSFPMLIVTGFELSQQITMDTGVPRKFHDILKIRGEVSWFDLAAALRKIAVVQDTGSLFHMDSKTYKPSNYRMLRLLETNPGIREILHKARPCSIYGMPKSLAAALWYQFGTIDLYDCHAFFDKFISGANLGEDDPIYLLRKVLMNNNTHQANRGSQMWKAALIIKAWNYFRDGEKVIALTWRKGGAAPEKFPIPH